MLDRLMMAMARSFEVEIEFGVSTCMIFKRVSEHSRIHVSAKPERNHAHHFARCFVVDNLLPLNCYGGNYLADDISPSDDIHTLESIIWLRTFLLRQYYVILRSR